MVKTPCDSVFHTEIFAFSLRHTHRKPNPQAQPFRHPTADAMLASDWLGVEIDVRSICYWLAPQTGGLMSG